MCTEPVKTLKVKKIHKVRLDRTRSQEAYMGSSPVLDKSESWVMSPGTRLASQGRNGLD